MHPKAVGVGSHTDWTWCGSNHRRRADHLFLLSVRRLTSRRSAGPLFGSNQLLPLPPSCTNGGFDALRAHHLTPRVHASLKATFPVTGSEISMASEIS